MPVIDADFAARGNPILAETPAAKAVPRLEKHLAGGGPMLGLPAMTTAKGLLGSAAV